MTWVVQVNGHVTEDNRYIDAYVSGLHEKDIDLSYELADALRCHSYLDVGTILDKCNRCGKFSYYVRYLEGGENEILCRKACSP